MLGGVVGLEDLRCRASVIALNDRLSGLNGLLGHAVCFERRDHRRDVQGARGDFVRHHRTVVVVDVVVEVVGTEVVVAGDEPKHAPSVTDAKGKKAATAGTLFNLRATWRR